MFYFATQQTSAYKQSNSFFFRCITPRIVIYGHLQRQQGLPREQLPLELLRGQTQRGVLQRRAATTPLRVDTGPQIQRGASQVRAIAVLAQVGAKALP